MKKYSKSNVQKPGENFSVRHSSKSSYHQPKNLKVKKIQGSKTIDRDTLLTHSSIDSTSVLKKHSMHLSKKIECKTRERNNDDDFYHKSLNSKPTASQLLSYTNKSKRLVGTSLDKSSVSKVSSKSKKRLNNSIS